MISNFPPRKTAARLMLALGAALAISACDQSGNFQLPGVEKVEQPAPGPSTDPSTGTGQPGATGTPPPAPPETRTDPLDPTQTVENPNANVGAPEGGTPFIEAPENSSQPISDMTPPVSAETGLPITLPVPADGATGPAESPAEPAPGAEPAPATPAPAPSEPAPAQPAPSEPAPSEPAPATPTTPASPVKPSFYYYSPGSLEPGTGAGPADATLFVPDMAFPIKSAPAYPQSQVYRFGGGVKGGDQCDARNFAAPWRDNFCETRTRDNATVFCSERGVHLGQDIRVGTPADCRAERSTKAADRTRHEVVAVEDGVISNVGSYSVTLRAEGRIYRYLHLNMAKLKVAAGQSVKKGDVIGYVSNDFGGDPTTLHLHFEIKINTAENSWQFAPPYSSLLAAYQRREGNPGERVVEGAVGIASVPAPR